MFVIGYRGNIPTKFLSWRGLKLSALSLPLSLLSVELCELRCFPELASVCLGSEHTIDNKKTLLTSLT